MTPEQQQFNKKNVSTKKHALMFHVKHNKSQVLSHTQHLKLLSPTYADLRPQAEKLM